MALLKVSCPLSKPHGNDGLTIEQAMAALKVPEGERQKYMDLLERQ